MDRRLLPLTAATFAVGTDAFVIAGLLPAVGADLDVGVAAAGQLITVFALVYALASPILGAATASLDRRSVMLTGLAVFVVGNVATALSEDFAFAVAARVATALGAALVTPQAGAIAAAIAPEDRRGRYLSMVTGGLTIATALGVPLGTLLSEIDWRATLWVVAGLGVLAAAGIAAWLPALRLPPIGLAARLSPLKDRTVLGIAATSVLVLISGNVLFTYIGAAAAGVTGGSQTILTLVLLASGLGAVVGNLIAGRLVDRFRADRVVLIAQGAYTLLLALSPLAFTGLAVAMPFTLVFGAVGWAVIVPQQHRLISRHPQAAPVLIGLNGSATYLGISLGGIIGGTALTWVPADRLGLIGALVGAVGIAVTAAMLAARRRTAAVPEPVATATAR
ncbi:MFS transporter [Glycomyces sp. NPDC047369]